MYCRYAPIRKIVLTHSFQTLGYIPYSGIHIARFTLSVHYELALRQLPMIFSQDSLRLYTIGHVEDVSAIDSPCSECSTYDELGENGTQALATGPKYIKGMSRADVVIGALDAWFRFH